MDTYIRYRFDGYDFGSVWSWRKVTNDEDIFDAPIADTMVAESHADLADRVRSVSAPAPLGYVNVFESPHNGLVEFEQPIRLIDTMADWEMLVAEMSSNKKRTSMSVVLGQEFIRTQYSNGNSRFMQNKIVTTSTDAFGAWKVNFDPKRKEKAKKRRASAQKRRTFPYAHDLDGFLKIARDRFNYDSDSHWFNLNLNQCGTGHGLDRSIYAAAALLRMLAKSGIEMTSCDRTENWMRNYSDFDKWLTERFFQYIPKMRKEMWAMRDDQKTQRPIYHCRNDGVKKCQDIGIRACERTCWIKDIDEFCRFLVRKKWQLRKKPKANQGAKEATSV
jgi:hypothetical protein